MAILSILRRRGTTLCAGALIVGLVACGGSESTAPQSSSCAVTPVTGQMTATVNGASFAANFLTIATAQNTTALGPNILQVSGATCPNGNVPSTQILITLGRLTPFTPGTYPLDPASQGTGGGYSGIAQVVRAPSLWYSNLREGTAAGSGTITFTTVTATRLAGTFQFTALAVTSNATADRQTMTVTSGAFDIPVR